MPLLSGTHHTFAALDAFGVSEDDVAAALERLGQPHDDASAEDWVKQLDIPAAARAALSSDGDLDKQTEAAWNNLESQISAILETRKRMACDAGRLRGTRRLSARRHHV